MQNIVYLILLFSALTSCKKTNSTEIQDLQNIDSHIVNVNQQDITLSDSTAIIDVSEKNSTEVPVSKKEKTISKVSEQAKKNESPTNKTSKNDVRQDIIPSKVNTTKVDNEPKNNTSTNTKQANLNQSEFVEPKPQVNSQKKETKIIEPEVKIIKPKIVEQQDVFSHVAFDLLLQKHVHINAGVHYKNFKTDKIKLEKYLSLMEKNEPTANWSKNKTLAYWINLYNASTIKLVLDNYPIKSIKDINNSKPWDLKWIQVGNKTLSLNAIENEIVRPTFKDARIHFALNCAAKSCPPIHNKAFTESNVQSLLDQLTSNFVNNPKQTVVEKENLNLSKIFDWYQIDFQPSVLDFVQSYYKEVELPKTVTYLEYDWSLNEIR